jgi:cytochrome c oxidase subunit 2
MSRTTLLILLAILAAAMVYGYTSMLPQDNDPRPVETPPTSSGPSSGTPAPGGAGEGNPEAGQQIFQANCVTCHTIDGGQGVGPTWQGLYGSQITLESGDTVTADEAYLRESILQPNARVHQGFPPAMPSFQGVLSDQQINDVIAFIRTLE